MGSLTSADTPYSDLRGVMLDPVLQPLASEAVRDYISWEELTTRKLPPDLSAAETWELLAIIRRFGAIRFPILNLQGQDYWYTLPEESRECLRTIERHCRSDSILHRTVQEREGHRFMVRSRIREAIATCQLDGVGVDWSRAGRMLQEGRTPDSDQMRLVLNSYQMLTELETFSAEPFTPELAREIYDRVTRGVDVSALQRGPARTNLAGTRNPDELSDPDLNREVLQRICDYANGVTGDPDEPVACKAYMIRSAMAYWHPLPDLNDTVARHLLRLFAYKSDYPGLGYISTSLKMRKWFEGDLEPGTTRFRRIDRRPVVGTDIDGTEDMLTDLQLTVAAVQELLGQIDKTQQEEAVLQEALRAHEHLNYRQHAVLARALSHPEAEFQIRAHQMSHRVVYQTARTDLLTLVDLGFLRQEIRGKAFVFLPAEDLAEQLGRSD